MSARILPALELAAHPQCCVGRENSAAQRQVWHRSITASAEDTDRVNVRENQRALLLEKLFWKSKGYQCGFVIKIVASSSLCCRWWACVPRGSVVKPAPQLSSCTHRWLHNGVPSSLCPDQLSAELHSLAVRWHIALPPPELQWEQSTTSTETLQCGAQQCDTPCSAGGNSGTAGITSTLFFLNLRSPSKMTSHCDRLSQHTWVWEQPQAHDMNWEASDISETSSKQTAGQLQSRATVPDRLPAQQALRSAAGTAPVLRCRQCTQTMTGVTHMGPTHGTKHGCRQLSRNRKPHHSLPEVVMVKNQWGFPLLTPSSYRPQTSPIQSKLCCMLLANIYV